jgi:hypothetical protein
MSRCISSTSQKNPPIFSPYESDELGTILSTKEPPKLKDSLHDYKMKNRLIEKWEEYSKKSKTGLVQVEGCIILSLGFFNDLQANLFPIMDSYSDIFFAKRNSQNSDSLRELYVLHSMNHILK